MQSKKKKMSLGSIKHAFKNIIWPRKKLVLIGIGLIIINRAAGLVLPGSTKYLIDDIIAKGNVTLLKWLLVVVGGALLIQSVTSFSLTRLLSVEAQHLISVLRSQMQQHIIFLPLRFFDNTKSGELVSRIMTDVEGVRNLVGTGLVQLFGGILTAIASLFLLITISPLMTLYTIVPLLIFGVISLKAFAHIRPIFRERGQINAEVTGRLTESLAGIRVIKGFHAENFEINVFAKGVEKVFKNVKTTLTATSLVTSLATLLMGIASITIMGVGGSMIIKGSMTVGDFFAFTLYLGFLVAPIVQMSNIGSQLTEAFAGLDRMEEILSLDKETDNPNRTETLEKLEGNIVFEDIAFAYEEGKEVLHSINFTAPPGSVTALVGSSGSGKTTIAGLAASFLTPQNGKIKIDGIDLSKVKIGDYRKHLGVVLQDDFLFEDDPGEHSLQQAGGKRRGCTGSCFCGTREGVHRSFR